MNLKTLAPILLTLAIFSQGCKKETEESDRFIINGLHDIQFNSSATSNMLPIQVAQMNGAQETVNLSVENLPDGFWAGIEPNSGTPTFGAMITIYQSGASKGGSYPFKVVARSASFTKTYTLNLVVPANGFSIAIPDTLEFNESAHAYAGVDRTSGGTLEEVTLSVSNVPTQLDASFDKNTGKPSFMATLTFNEKTQLPEGNYPITISGKSASYNATSTFVLRARAWTGYTIDGKFYRGSMSFNEGWNIESNQNTSPNRSHVNIQLTGG